MKILLALWVLLFAVLIVVGMSACRTFHMEGTIDTTEASPLPVLP